MNGDVKNQNWLVKSVIICLASICICMANNLVHENVRDEEPLSEITASSYSAPGRADISASALQCSTPRNVTSAHSLRPSFQRQNTSNSSRTGFTMIKAGKSMNEYSTSLFHRSIANFPSGMNESSHRLIGLGKLII